MPDQPGNPCPIDRSRVATHDAWKLRYWCGRFVCTEEQLREAIQRVGVGVTKVEDYLNARVNLRSNARARGVSAR
jgi:hypothetical protein